MHIRPLTTLFLLGSIGLGCDDVTQDQSPGEVLARDSVLASGLQRADTSSFAEDAEALTLGRTAPRQAIAGSDFRSAAAASTRGVSRLARASTPPERLAWRSAKPAPTRQATTRSDHSASQARAAEILQRVPGAAFPE